VVVVVNGDVVNDSPIKNSVGVVLSAYHLNDGLVTPVALADRDAVSPEHIVVPSAVMLSATANGLTVTVTSFLSAALFSQ
jgi:hypothetical protein